MIRTLIRKIDWVTASTMILLSALGLVVIYSTTLNEAGTFNRAQKQALSFLLGLVVFVVLSIIDYRAWRSYATVLYITTLIVLVAVLFLGTNVRGTHSWFDFGFYRFQPSEVGKFILVIVLGHFFSKHVKDRRRFGSVIRSLIYVTVPFILILLEPDLGTGLVYIGLWLGMLLASGMRLRHFVILMLIGSFILTLGWTQLKPYQKDRILVFMNPNSSELLGAHYNVHQSQIAIGSGGLIGKGLGQGTQSQLKFLPEQQTDFIFAAAAEELGFGGSVFLLTLFAILIVRMIWIAHLARDDFGMFIAVGVASIFLVQIIVNVGMNLGVMPVTGIPLPLVSYGGSSVLSTLALLGLVESVYIHRKGIEFK
jgi:rod shape determining protein RodA